MPLWKGNFHVIVLSKQMQTLDLP